MGITTTVENDDLAQSRGREAGLVEVAEKAGATLRAYQSDWAEILLLAARGKDSTTPGFCGDHLKQMLGRAATTPLHTAGINDGRDLPRRRRSTGPRS